MAGRNIKLQRLRIGKLWTLRTAAQHMGVSTTTLFSAEQGAMPRVDHAIQIAGTYNRSVEELWTPAPCDAVCLCDRGTEYRGLISAIADAILWDEEILKEIDNRWPAK
jgi:DNA-binding XRE family transcriptional regulator